MTLGVICHGAGAILKTLPLCPFLLDTASNSSYTIFKLVFLHRGQISITSFSFL